MKSFLGCCSRSRSRDRNHRDLSTMAAPDVDTTFYTTQVSVTINKTSYTIPMNCPIRYKEIIPISAGAQGVVCRALDTKTNTCVAIKKLTQAFDRTGHAKRTFREFKIMTILNHKNIIKLLDIFTPAMKPSQLKDLYFVLELMDADLSAVIKQRLDHSRISYLTRQLMLGMKHVNMAKVIHRDLKPQNILVDSSCNLKIGDFGLARDSEHTEEFSPYVTTRYYRAPEVVLEMGYDEKADVWSIGCILGELVDGNVLFPAPDQQSLWTVMTRKIGFPLDEFGDFDADFFNKIPPEVRSGVDSLLMSSQPADYLGETIESLYPDHVFPEDDPNFGESLNKHQCRDLLAKLLKIKPEDRLSIDDALNHPYIKAWDMELDDITNPTREYNDDEHDIRQPMDSWKKMVFDEVHQYRNQSTH